MKTTVNTRVKLLRKSLRLTQNEFALELGISPSLVSKVEAGETPSTGTLDAIMNTYNVPESWLIDGKGDIKYEKAKSKSTDPWKDEAWHLAKDQIQKKDDLLENLGTSFAILTKMMKDSGMSFLHRVEQTGTH